MKDEIKKEILDLLSGMNITSEEMNYLDTYIKATLEKYDSLMSTHMSVVNDKDKLASFQKEIVKVLKLER